MVSPYIEREAKRLNIGHKPTEVNDAQIYIPEAEAEIVPLVIRLQNAVPYAVGALVLLSLALDIWYK